MKSLYYSFLSLIFILSPVYQIAQDTHADHWFQEAKLGIFIHWGIYAVDGVAESWAFKTGGMPYDEYMDQLNHFKGENYDPVAWAQLFKQSGARYAYLTTKHHDGVALWPTVLSELNVVEKTPAARDLIGPYAEAMRDAGIKVGLYFSILDWSHPDYATVFHEEQNWNDSAFYNRWYSPFDHPKFGEEDTVRWNKFVAFSHGQIKELCEAYDPDLFWFDGDWSRSTRQHKFAQLYPQIKTEWTDGALLNDRLGDFGDYYTAEQGQPILRPEGMWEYSMTLNNAWGWRSDPSFMQEKSLNYIIKVFAETIGMGGNLLLAIGPRADGSITEVQAERLQGLGRWIKKHEEAIYPTRQGIAPEYFYGPTTLSQDSTTLYLFYPGIPNDALILKGLKNVVKQVRLVGSNKTLSYHKIQGADWRGVPGQLAIDLTTAQIDPHMTVIAVELEGSIDLYRGFGGKIESN